MPIYRKVNKNFFKKWTPEMAYVLGFFAADGSMIKNNRGAHFVEFQICDKETLEQIRLALGSDHKISIRGPRSRNSRVSYRIQIGSKEIFEDLLKLGFTPNKTKTLTLPDIPKIFFGDFIRGYFDGDGNVYFKKHFAKDRNKERWVFSTRFTSGAKSFLTNLHTALKSYGLKKGFILNKSNERGYELVFSHHDSLALYKLMYNNRACSLEMKRKRKTFERAFKALDYEMRS